MERITYSDKNEWQDKVGYCRAIKIGNQLIISGTVVNDDEGKPVGGGGGIWETRLKL